MAGLLILLALASGLAAQVPTTPSVAAAPSPAANSTQPPMPPVKPEDKCTISGAVFSVTTGEPLRKADVLLVPLQHSDTQSPYGATTDGSGRFTIANIDPGQYRLTVQRNGFVQGSYGDRGSPRRSGETLTLALAQTLKDLNIKLVPQGVITGRIVDENGDPLQNVQVLCMRYSWQRGQRRLLPHGGDSTNDLGEYRIFDLAPGKYIVSAIRRDHFNWGLSPKGKAEEGYAPNYYPNASDPANAAIVQITPGAQIRGIDMTLQKIRTVRVTGHILSASTGKPARNANIMLFTESGEGMYQPVSVASVRDPSGKFELHGIVPGSYILDATKWDTNSREFYRQPIQVGSSNIENLDISLSPGAEIKGIITAESNGDLKNSNVRIFLNPKERNPMGGAGGDAVHDDGSFTMTGVVPSVYNMYVFGLPEEYYVKSVRLGDLDASNGMLDLSQGVPGGEFKIVVSPNGAQVEGDVHDDKDQPATGVRVVLVPDSGRRAESSLFKMAATDQNGHFKIKGITPGNYKLFAWESIEPGQDQDPDFLKSVEGSGTAVSLEENAHATQTLKLLPAPPDE